MNNNEPKLQPIISRFFSLYLPGERGLSKKTIDGYIISFKLLLKYFGKVKGIKPEKLTLADLNRENIVDFLDYLEENGSAISSRNVRLSAIHSFFQYVKYAYPRYLEDACDVLMIRYKREPKSVATYLSVEATKELLHQPDWSTDIGKRDTLILTFLYETGTRVSEMIDVRVGDLRFEEPAVVKVVGKGNKGRIIPISKDVALLLQDYIAYKEASSESYLFTSRTGKQLTRGAVWDMVKRYVEEVNERKPGLIPEDASPHTLRHSKAMHMMNSDVNIIYIRDFLGHATVRSTEIYARTDSKRKREALDKAYVPDLLPEGSLKKEKIWNEDKELMDFLTRLSE